MVFAIRVVLFVIFSIIAAALMPYLAVQQPVTFFLVVGVFIFFFSRSFRTRQVK
ncbi:MAG TPA: hypothetical protein VNT60_06740 [Deinococcales bacterium]|nr:hypothetical protein [Deinococcales bacterium]